MSKIAYFFHSYIFFRAYGEDDGLIEISKISHEILPYKLEFDIF